MRIVIQGISAAVLLVALAGSAAAQSAGPHDPVTAVETTRLPTFCWKQMGVANAEGPEFKMPPGCGPGTNHYCMGLVKLNRAKSASGKHRITLLRSAATDVGYTEKAIAGYPKCGLRDHVATSKAEVESFLRIYGGAQSRTSAAPK